MSEKLFEDLGLEDEKASQLEEAFDKAVMAKSVELMETQVEKLVEEKEEILKEEYQEKIENLEDTLDGYMTSVVEEFVAENAPIYEAQINEEKTKALLEHFDAMLKIAGIDMLDIQEAKDDSSLEAQNEALSEKIDRMQDELIEARREADRYLKAGIIAEMSADLSDVEASKFEKLATLVAFAKDDKYVASLETIKESIIDKRDDSFTESEVRLPKDAYKDGKVDVKAATDFSKYV